MFCCEVLFWNRFIENLEKENKMFEPAGFFLCNETTGCLLKLNKTFKSYTHLKLKKRLKKLKTLNDKVCCEL